jgi:7-carboxy-7-deazaguanine synthase
MSGNISKIANDELFEGGAMLPLMEEFYTIQGEGYNTGKAAYFIRVGGCDVGCHWCDVKESWDATKHPLTSTQKIIENVLLYPAKAVVVTGGEPSMYPLDFLTNELRKNNVRTFIETSGAYPLTGVWDWVCISPKKTLKPIVSNFAQANELKVIIHNNHDFVWAQENYELCMSVNKGCKFYLQPEWSKSKEMIPKIVDFVMQNPQWEISLQTHKYMHIP